MAPKPYADLTGYLAALAEQLGYHIDPYELEPATGLHPALVIGWASAGAFHAATTYTRTLLAAPAAVLREHPSAAVGSQHLLADLLRRDRRLDEELDSLSRQYATACRTLLATGLVVPRTEAARLVRPVDNRPQRLS